MRFGVSGFDGRMIRSVGLGVITLGRQSGEYSPPALCLALTAISSAISLETMGKDNISIGNFDLRVLVVVWCGGFWRRNLLLQCTSLIS